MNEKKHFEAKLSFIHIETIGDVKGDELFIYVVRINPMR